MKRSVMFLAFSGLLFGGLSVSATEFRVFQAIASPDALPDGAVAVETLKPVSPALVSDALKDIAKSYGTAGLENFLADEFFDKQGLLDAISENVPQDVNLRILSVQGIATLNQFEKPDDFGEGRVRVSTVTATASTNLEFNDPVNGFQRIPSTLEFYLRVTEPL